jgi:tetratricopeptide (TPR) repeat protein
MTSNFLSPAAPGQLPVKQLARGDAAWQVAWEAANRKPEDQMPGAPDEVTPVQRELLAARARHHHLDEQKRIDAVHAFEDIAGRVPSSVLVNVINVVASYGFADLPEDMQRRVLDSIERLGADGHAIDTAWVALGVIAAGLLAINLPILIRQRRAMPYFRSAVEHFENDDLDRAIADFTRAIEINPKFEIALIRRGTAYSNRGDYDQAIADYTKVVELRPRPLRGIVALAIGNRGIVYQNKGDLDRAVADHSYAIELTRAPHAYIDRGNAFAAQGDYERAIADYTKAIELEPDSATAYFNRGNAFADRGEHERAIANYTTAIELEPDSAAYEQRSKAYQAQGDTVRAQADRDMALKLGAVQEQPHKAQH